MLTLGIDIGTSSIKLSVVDVATGKSIAQSQYPQTEATIISQHAGWAEQDPNSWWHYIQQAMLQLHAMQVFNAANIAAIGIAYQMHGLVVVNKNGESLRNSIIWCDSRAVTYGQNAFESIGEAYCLKTYLNSPGNFTAAKLAWVKHNEPELYKNIATIMLPGDYIALQLTNNCTTTPSALSEAILWDFTQHTPAKAVMDFFEFNMDLLPTVKDVFSHHGQVSVEAAQLLGIKRGIPVTYKAGDQPNNALALHVMQPGEVAATAGTSGVIYGIADKVVYDAKSRLNSFAHVNHTINNNRIGVLLCINGCGILNSFMRRITGGLLSYQQINDMAETVAAGSNGLTILPFGNGAERILENQQPGASIIGLNLNTHTQAHMFRAVQEGIAFAFKYGLDIMRQNGMQPTTLKAGKANLFLSNTFCEILANTLNIPIELYDTDGATGAALGAAVGANFITTQAIANGLTKYKTIEPTNANAYIKPYATWLTALQPFL